MDKFLRYLFFGLLFLALFLLVGHILEYLGMYWWNGMADLFHLPKVDRDSVWYILMTIIILKWIFGTDVNNKIKWPSTINARINKDAEKPTDKD